MSEFLVGVHGLRTFRVSDDGNLLPVTALDDSWRGGVCIARCRRKAAHHAPANGCSCGVYTFRNLTVLRSQYAQAHLLVAVVALEGQTLAGSKGWRSEAGRIEALWVKPGALPDKLAAALQGNLADVAFHDDVFDMLTEYPDLTPGTLPAASPMASSTAGPGVPGLEDPAKLSRVPLYVIGTGLVTLLFVTAGRGGTTGAGTGPGNSIAGLGRSIVANFDYLMFWTLIIGFNVRLRMRGRSAAALSTLTRVLIPVWVAAEAAAVINGDPLNVNGLSFAFVCLLVWAELWKFAHLVGRTGGISGLLARQLLRTGRSVWRLVRPRRGNMGVNYSPVLRNPLDVYPLVMPVHLEDPTPPAPPTFGGNQWSAGT